MGRKRKEEENENFRREKKSGSELKNCVGKRKLDSRRKK